MSAATTYRMLPPVAVQQQQFTFGSAAAGNLRSYSGALGSAYDISINDALALSANGWIIVALSGPTTSRPTPTSTPAVGPAVTCANVGDKFYDTTLNELIICDGVTWRSAAGASV
jgi:hypothetical protein